MTDIILKHGGTVDKYMGDCIMAFWNAPLDCPNHQEMAIISAREMKRKLTRMNIKEEFGTELKIGIGINTGEAVVGNMGSEQRFDYSVLGDAVNLASRLEGVS
jgi:adenylate cyclase